MLEEIYASYDTLQSDQKEKVRTMTDALRQSKEGLSGLKNEVIEKVNYETLEKQLSDEAEAKLGQHRYSKWLIEPYKKHIHEKIAELKSEKTVEKSGWQKFIAFVKDGFFAVVISWVG